MIGFAEYKLKIHANASLHVYGPGSDAEELIIRNVLKKYDDKVLSSIVFSGIHQ